MSDKKQEVSESKEIKDLKDTLHLPQTDFPMRGSLPQREPEQIQSWFQNKTYEKLIEKNKKNPKSTPFLLHDGPPYANGAIHIGHSLNKVLKDIVVKYKSMQGHVVHYVPGWDCHGLPIEVGVEKQLAKKKINKKELSKVEFRNKCREYAKEYIQIQKEQFQRLEIFGDWEHPYLTMSNEYISEIIRALGKCAKEGVLYKGNKPVHWDPVNETALAEAEIEYRDKKSPSIYVKFDFNSTALESIPVLKKAAADWSAKRVSVVIWTTTPWTLPANLACAFHPEFDYIALGVEAPIGFDSQETQKEVWVIAKELQARFEKEAGLTEENGKKSGKILAEFKADILHQKTVKHPFINRESLLVFGDHVTLESGTGVVHTAPGHGADDFQVGRKYGLEPLSPVDHRGCYTQAFSEMQGTHIWKADPLVIEKLKATNNLIALHEITHSYPHSERSEKPVFFRATPQWFIAVDPKENIKKDLRSQALKAVQEVNWVPPWGQKRIEGMLESRPDWCISRQRFWGAPITVFYCKSCEEPQTAPEIFEHVAKLVEKNGVDVWFSSPEKELLPDGWKCSKCQKQEFKKEEDILDVWFDSGVSHLAVCKRRNLGWPADLYLEGSDQHRGWFQVSLLTALATEGRAPFKTVLTHGFVNDQHGKKMSKSKGNVVSPHELIQKNGADILRLWIVLEDYRDDLNFSNQSMERVADSYRKIRNTLRFMLGNLFDYDPRKDEISKEEMSELDRWILSRAAKIFSDIEKAYDAYEFHIVYHSLVNFCNVDLSSLYLDICKDRLYASRAQSTIRRSCQTTLWYLLSQMTRLLAPILSFTAEEVWKSLSKEAESVFLQNYPSHEQELKQWRDENLENKYQKIFEIRDRVLKVLEEARAKKEIGHPREASVDMRVDGETKKLLESIQEDFSRLCIASEINIQLESSDFGVRVKKTSHERCERCWVHLPSVGQNSQYLTLCHRCVEAIS